MKSVFLIALVAVAMIGVMVPNVFAETVSNNIGSATIDENSEVIDQYGYCETIVYGHVEIVNGRGEILVTRDDGSTYGPLFFQAGRDGSFTSKVSGCGSMADDVSFLVSYGGKDIGVLQINAQQYFKDQKAAAEQKVSEEQRAAEKKAAEKKAAEKKAAEKKAAEKKAAEARAAEAAIRAAEAKAAQDLTNLLIIGGIAIIIISLVIILVKRKNKKSTTPQRSTTRPTPPPSPSGNTESSTMFFYECPKCHSADIQNNPDGSVNCPDCGYRG